MKAFSKQEKNKGYIYIRPSVDIIHHTMKNKLEIHMTILSKGEWYLVKFNIQTLF